MPGNTNDYTQWNEVIPRDGRLHTSTEESDRTRKSFHSDGRLCPVPCHDTPWIKTLQLYALDVNSDHKIVKCTIQVKPWLGNPAARETTQGADGNIINHAGQQQDSKKHYRLRTRSLQQFQDQMKDYLHRFYRLISDKDLKTILSDLHMTIMKSLKRLGEEVKPLDITQQRKRMLTNDWHDRDYKQVMEELNKLL